MVYIVTASPTGMLMPCLEYFGSDAILGMDFGFDERRIITGNLAGPSCYGPGKASKALIRRHCVACKFRTRSIHRPTGEAMGSHADKFNKWAGVI
ncbi:hypothetical protein Pelo_18466 [Pelomyxa schiedti]|nr:hypothetical protein Pelo_18466 [Pelomyxa schiedti]